MQGMGWTCIEELVWGDSEHTWVRPGTLHTRGPGPCCCVVKILGAIHLVSDAAPTVLLMASTAGM